MKKTSLSLVVGGIMGVLMSASAFAGHATFQLVSEGTTRTPEGNNVCPKTYTFKFEFKAMTSGPYTYQFQRSDGGKGPILHANAFAGQLVNLTETWQLGASLSNAWVGVSFNGGSPMHGSSFTLNCGGQGESAAQLQLISEGTTRTPEGNNVCPKTYTFKFEMKALSSGPYSYRIERSDGAKGPQLTGKAYAGQIVQITDTWQLGRSLSNAWVGVSVNGGAPQHNETFTLVCQ